MPKRPRTSFDFGYLPSRNRNRSRSSSEPSQHKRAYSEGSRKRFRNYDHESASPARRRFKKEYDTPSMYRGKEPHPILLGHQLVGDSLFLRFAEQVLHQRCVYGNGLRYLGLCVSGQTIQELTTRVIDKFSPIGEKIILLIGTNNLLQGTDIETMKSSLEQLVKILLENVKKIVILTLPPIPKLESCERYRDKYNQYNGFVKNLPKLYDNVFVVDVTEIFLTDNRECDMYNYERWYDDNRSRPDRIHLNTIGLLRLREKIWKSKAMKDERDTDDTDDDENDADDTDDENDADEDENYLE